MERKQETKIVKEALTKAGYQDIRVRHGRGTAWGWMDIDVTVNKTPFCYCHELDKDDYPGTCSFCMNQRRNEGRKVQGIVLKATGRSEGEYGGNTLIHVELKELATA